MVCRSVIRALVILLFFTLPAWATQDGWPALFDVTGVASDDRLNIRTEPGVGGEIIGTLAPDETDIEVIRPNPDLTWGMVNFEEGSGWVSLNYLERTSTNWDGQFPDFTKCSGTEPFWRLRRSDDVVTLSRLDAEADQSFPMDWQSGAMNDRRRHSFRAGDVVGVISNEMCGDGMSDLNYGLGISLIHLSEERLYQGCCSIQPLSE